MEVTQKYYSAREAADVIGVSYRLILKWIADGELKCYWVGDGSMIRISPEQIHEYMENHQISRDNGETYGELEKSEEPA